MRRAFMVTGLSIAAIAAGCGDQAPTETPKYVEAEPTAQDQARIDALASKAAQRFTRRAVSNVRAFQTLNNEFKGADISFAAAKEPNYDGAGHTRVKLSNRLGRYGVDSALGAYSLETVYADGQPEEVRRIEISVAHSDYKKDRDGEFALNKTASYNHTIHFKKDERGHWQVYDTFTVPDVKKEIATTPNDVQDRIDEAAGTINTLIY